MAIAETAAGNGWTDELLDLTRRLWTDGATASDIAEHISRHYGIAFSRCAVSAKLIRLELRRGRCSGPKKVSRARKTPFLFSRAPILPVRDVEPEPEDAPPVIKSRRVALVDLKVDDCRFVVSGEGAESIFCGLRRRDEKSSYCIAHCRIVYQTLQRRY
jgi:hypothetical protein